jgi:hypothetical protein
MAIRIELWADGRIVGGLEAWWDRMEIALPVDRSTKYPLLSRVDPYGDIIFEGAELESLAGELRTFVTDSPESLRPLLTDLIGLCDEGLVARDAKLKFLAPGLQ